MDNFYNIELDDLADKIGDFIHYWGFKKIHGKIWCHLYLSKDPIDAQTLMKKLKISKALISQSLTELEQYGVIECVGKCGGRCDMYVSHHSIMNAILHVLRNREKKLLASIFSSYRGLQSLPQEKLDELRLDPCRLNQLGRMIAFGERFLGLFINFEKIDFARFRDLFQKNKAS